MFLMRWGIDAMWRFILITFGFLGFAFYELSGGADYAPREGSRQDLLAKARLFEAQKAAALAEAKPEHIAPAPQTANTAPEAVVILASATADTPEGPAPAKPAPVSLSQPIIDTAKAAQLTKPASEPKPLEDIREVTGNVVNMRRGPGTDFQRMGKLRRGDRVEVLRDDGEGWVKLRVIETGRIGFMADFLLTAPLDQEAFASN